MSENKFLSDFKITQQEVNDFLDLVFLNPDTLNSESCMALFKGETPELRSEAFVHAENILGKEMIDLIMMYMAFTLSLHLRRENPQEGEWRKIRQLEMTFLRLTKSAETVPPAVGAISYVIHHYWAYLAPES